MTALLKSAFEAVAGLPDGEQDEYALMLLRLLGRGDPPIQLTAEEDPGLAEAEAEAARGEFATEAELAAIWAKYRA